MVVPSFEHWQGGLVGEQESCILGIPPGMLECLPCPWHHPRLPTRVIVCELVRLSQIQSSTELRTESCPQSGWASSAGVIGLLFSSVTFNCTSLNWQLKCQVSLRKPPFSSSPHSRIHSGDGQKCRLFIQVVKSLISYSSYLTLFSYTNLIFIMKCFRYTKSIDNKHFLKSSNTNHSA